MNFLSHYYHEYPVNNPLFAAGLILPDILSNYSFRRGKVIKLHPWRLQETTDEAQQVLSDGVRRHYAVDAAFHDSEWFSRQTRYISTYLQSADISCFPRRMYAVAHVMLEIILDRSLMTRDSGLTDGFYDMIDMVAIEDIKTLMTVNGHAPVAVGVSRHFDEFRNVRFLYDYLNDERLTALLGRINIRLGNPPMTAADRKNLTTAIYDIEKTLLLENFPIFRTDS